MNLFSAAVFVTLVLVALKIAAVTTISWWIAFAPVLIAFAICIFFFVACLIVFGLATLVGTINR